MTNEIKKKNENSLPEKHSLDKRIGIISLSKSYPKQALPLPIIWRALTQVSNTRQDYKIKDGDTIVKESYPAFRAIVKQKLKPLFYIEPLTWNSEKEPYYTIDDTIEIFKDFRLKMI